ncbi:hypothetical protein MUO79_02855 [Candidatus Bathyarchaeota archaeon]|nr:hypothetical protein [Candidatus Bathyarchaeota archaeon]
MERKILLVLVTFVIVIVIAVAAFLVSSFPASQPIVKFDASVSPQTFKTSEAATLSASFENLDQDKQHDMRLRLIANWRVHLFIGSDELTKEVADSGNYTYSFVLQPGQKIQQPFNVKVPELETGIPSQPLSITVEDFIDNQLESSLTKEVKFTAEKS